MRSNRLSEVRVNHVNSFRRAPTKNESSKNNKLSHDKLCLEEAGFVVTLHFRVHIVCERQVPKNHNDPPDHFEDTRNENGGDFFEPPFTKLSIADGVKA
jgi:hypothetical protein